MELDWLVISGKLAKISGLIFLDVFGVIDVARTRRLRWSKNF